MKAKPVVTVNDPGGSMIMLHLRRHLPRALVLATLATSMWASPAWASVESPASQQSTPVVTGPVTGGHGVPTLGLPVPDTAFELADVGYTSEEYFLSGSTTAYSSSAPLTPDGKWTAQSAGTAPYTTAHRRVSAVESGQVQRHGRRRVVECECRLRRISHLGLRPQRDDP